MEIIYFYNYRIHLWEQYFLEAGISGNMIEDERLLGSVDFGFGSQSKSFEGNVGISPYHMDIILRSPTVLLDGKTMIENNSFNEKMGFLKM